MRGSRVGSLENHKAIWYLSNTGPNPLEYHKATEPHSMLGRRWPAFRVIWILSPPLILKKVVGPHLLKLSGSAHGSYCSVEPAQMRSFARTFAARIDKEREGDRSSEQVLDMLPPLDNCVVYT